MRSLSGFAANFENEPTATRCDGYAESPAEAIAGHEELATDIDQRRQNAAVSVAELYANRRVYV